MIKINRNPQLPMTSANETRVCLNIGNVGYDHKPTGAEVGAIVSDLASAQQEVTLTELLRLMN